jgi:hypothetical protein
MATTDEKADMALKALLILFRMDAETHYNRNPATTAEIAAMIAQIESQDSP